MATDAELRDAVQSWLEAQPRRPEHVEPTDWLRFEQDKHQKAAGRRLTPAQT